MPASGAFSWGEGQDCPSSTNPGAASALALSYRSRSSPSPEVRGAGGADHVRMINPTDVVLITGASKGLGLALARLFARHKHPLVLNARGAEALERVTAELSAQTDVLAVPGDV